MAKKFAQGCLVLFAIATLASQTAMDVFASLFALGFVWLALEQKTIGPGFRTLKWKLILGAWIGTFFLSFLLNMNSIPLFDWLKLLDFRWLLLAAMIGSVLVWSPPSSGVWRSLQICLILGSAYAIAVFFLKSYPLDPEHSLDVLADGTVRTGGFHKQPIVFAHLYALWVCFFVGILIVLLSHNFKIAFRLEHLPLWLGTVAGSLAILLSFTRGVWISLFVGLFAMFFVVRRKLAFGFLLAGLVLSGAMIQFWPPVRERVLQSFNSQDSERWWIWKGHFQIFLDYPVIGPGYNQNVGLLPEYFLKIQADEGLMISHAHNQFLHILAGTGILGLLSYLAFWIFVASVALQALKEQRNQSLLKAGVALGIFGAIVSFAVGGLTESNFEHSKIRYTWALLIGLLIWVKARPPASSQRPR